MKDVDSYYRLDGFSCNCYRICRPGTGIERKDRYGGKTRMKITNIVQVYDTRIYEYCKKEYEKLSDQTKAILFGLILGDGSLKRNKGYANARISFRHSLTQQEYFEWKVSRLREELSSEKESWAQSVPEYRKEFGKEKLRYESGACPSLTYLYYITHRGSKNGEIEIQRSWLNKMTPLSLAIWWCDDGSLVENGSQGLFCTDGFGKSDVEVLDRYMKKV